LDCAAPFSAISRKGPHEHSASRQKQPFQPSIRLPLRRIEILTKSLVRFENNIFAVLSFESSDRKMTARDRLEVVNKSIVDCSASERTYHRNSLRSGLL
jgi:hypothetical protein